MKLSIIIPVFNEAATIAQVLANVVKVDLGKINKEVIIVDDGSTDATASVISNFKSPISNFKSLQHKKNMGKGTAVRTGIAEATGDYIVIQDADLEYNPRDIPKLITSLLEKKSEVIYGTRLQRLPNFSRDERTFRFFIHYLGNRALSFITSILYGQWITDMETGYKLFPKKAVSGMRLSARSFDFEPEITAKLLKKDYKILEIPITTNPRGYDEGKKLNTVRDGIIALWTLLKFRFVN